MTITPEPSDHLRIVAVIQARMGSTRLPGKVLKPVAGKPLLWHIVHRLKQSEFIEQIAITTSTHPRDDAIVEWGKDNGVVVIRGPEEDVLARFARAAEMLDADIIVRVSSDAPFIDAPFVDHLITALLEQDGDYVLLEDGAVTAHEGVDPFTRRALDKLMMDAHEDPVAREHVTGYFKLHPDFVRIARAGQYPPLARKGGRLTIDTPDDLAFVEAVHERMAARAGEASLADLLLLLDREPALRRLNGHVKQKPIASNGTLALIRCDGGESSGYGHVKRMVALARAMRDCEGIGSIFCLNGTADALEPARAAGFEARLLGDDPVAALDAAVTSHKPDVLVCDVRGGLTREALAAMKRKVAVAAVVDDGSDLRLAADIAYYPPLAQTERMEWAGSKCKPRIGWQWSLLGLSRVAAPSRVPLPRPSLLVAMGGSDPLGLTLTAARALAKLDPVFRARFVIGPGMADGARLAKAIVALAPHFETIEGASDLATEYASSDLALASFGVTAYELAACGVPALYLCLTEDHAESASTFERAGMGLSLGLAERAQPQEIARAVWGLLSNPARRREMRAAGLMTIDGEGASRIAADIAQTLAEKRKSAARRAAG
ncbi:MAG: NTP transferase domain-containing protein [Rhizomicrobium sp.]|jgi:spore coat polysaccharide biosynthesis protein SpsF